MHHWDTRVDGDPVQCRSAAAGLERRARELRASVRALVPRCESGWTGPASASASQRIGAAARGLSRTAARCTALADALGAFAGALDRVAEALRAAEAVAIASGLTIDRSGFFAPGGHPAAVAVEQARAAEATAHAVLRARLPAPPAPGAWDSLGLALLDAPPHDGDTAEWLAWGVAQPGIIAGLPGTRVNAHLAWLTRSAAESARPLAARVGGAIEAARPVGSHALRELGLAGSALTVGLSVREQWTADAADPSMSETERSLRAGVRGVVEGGSTVALGALGAAALAPIPGGAYVGGTVGAWVGGRVGGLVADVAVEHVDDVIAAVDAVGDAASDAVDAVGDAASDAVHAAGDAVGAVGDAAGAVGDVAADVADRLCFWD